MTSKYNKSAIMRKAWQLFKCQSVRTDEMFANCLKQSWSNAKGIKDEIVKVTDFVKVRKDILTFIKWKLNNNSDDVEDLTQDTMLKVFTSLSSYNESKGNFRNWYLTIANNTLKDFYRSNKDRIKEISVADFINENGTEKIQIADVNECADNDIKRTEMHSDLRKAIKTLNPEYRKIIILRFMQNMSCDEIADYCNIPLNTVLSLIARGKKLLQGQLKRQLV